MIFQSASKSISEDIEYICGLFFETLRTPIYFLDNNGDLFCSFSYGQAVNPLHEDKRKLFSQLFNLSGFSEYPVVKSTSYLENYFAVSLQMKNIFLGTFVVGPSTYSYVSPENIDSLIADFKLPFNYKKELLNYFNALPVMDYSKLLNASLLLYYIVYNIKLDLSEVMERNCTLENVNLKIKSEYENIISKNRRHINFHHSRNHELIMLQCIRDGNTEKLKEVLKKPLDGEYGILSKDNPLRSLKNIFICGVALATRAAMDGGLNSESAYTLSDSYIQCIEETNQISNLLELVNKMYCDFAERVYEVKKLKYPKAILTCEAYILKHLYEDITLIELARITGLNSNYLSELFKKVSGITISEYINKEKIEEGKRLLSSSSYSILEISTWLSFHDQSHFTRTFKKYTGSTPKKYRDANTVIY